MKTILHLVHFLGDQFSADTNEIADQFFKGNRSKARKVLKATPGIYSQDVNGSWSRSSNGKKECLIWQLRSDVQGWSLQEAADYCVEHKMDPSTAL